MRARNFLEVRAPFYISLWNPGNNRATLHTFFMNMMYAEFLPGNKNEGNIGNRATNP